MTRLRKSALYVTDSPFLDEPAPAKTLLGLAMSLIAILAATALMGALVFAAV